MNSLERINPRGMAANEVTGDQTLYMHIERYHYAGKYLIPGTVADVACGVGYGSHLLATEYGENITRIIAADIDAGSIELARSNWHHAKIDFQVADALHFQSPVALHNIVSLETIEHLTDPASFIKNISAQLVQGGRFITSVPITPSMDANPYHLHDFTTKSFIQLFTRAGFKQLHAYKQVQSYNPVLMLRQKEERSKDLRKNMLAYYWQRPGKFFLRIRSVLTDGFTNKYLVAVFEKL